MKKFTKEHFLIIGMITIMLGLAYLSFERFIDGQYIRQPIVFEDPFEIRLNKTEYVPGETVYGYLTFCKYRALTGTIQWNLIDGTLILFPPRDGSVGVGCHKNLRVEIETIPAYIVPGELMHFEANLVYHVNNLRTINVPLKTQSFIIIEDPNEQSNEE